MPFKAAYQLRDASTHGSLARVANETLEGAADPDVTFAAFVARVATNPLFAALMFAAAQRDQAGGQPPATSLDTASSAPKLGFRCPECACSGTNTQAQALQDQQAQDTRGHRHKLADLLRGQTTAAPASSFHRISQNVLGADVASRSCSAPAGRW